MEERKKSCTMTHSCNAGPGNVKTGMTKDTDL